MVCNDFYRNHPSSIGVSHVFFCNLYPLDIDIFPPEWSLRKLSCLQWAHISNNLPGFYPGLCWESLSGVSSLCMLLQLLKLTSVWTHLQSDEPNIWYFLPVRKVAEFVPFKWKEKTMLKMSIILYLRWTVLTGCYLIIRGPISNWYTGKLIYWCKPCTYNCARLTEFSLLHVIPTE